jgi:pimeloyl-ACP methyl ester carboxylesterase
MVRVTRHFVDVREGAGTRRVHYRMAGSGPPVLLVHQSPRSSAEWLPLMERWGGDFTLIASDTPGFGDSAPLANPAPAVEDYADAVLAFLDAVGLEDVAAYGFHSGAIILVTAARRAPQRFRAIAAGGYAVWSEAEKADFGANYTPDFLASPYGEHLAWLWHRLLEQTWFFPWYRAEEGARLPFPSDDPAKVHDVVMEVLAAGNSFSLGYAAVLRANRDVPEQGAPTPPVLIVGYRGDPLTAHIDRLGELPESWAARKVEAPAEAEDAARAWLLPHVGPERALRGEAGDEGFVHVAAAGFDGLLHWRGAGELVLHAPGGAAGGQGLAFDLPGHGLSDDWPAAPANVEAWAEVVVAAVRALGVSTPSVRGGGWGAVLAKRVAARLGINAEGALPHGDPADWRARGLPDVTPDRYGAYLHRAWQVARASVFFEPWFAPSAANARSFTPEEIAPERLAKAHLALLRARRGREYLQACLGDD